MFEYELVYKLKDQMSFTGSYEFQVDLNSSVRDSTLVLSPSELHFLVSRKQKVSLPVHALKKNRIRILSNSLMLLSAASTIAPRLEHNFQIIQSDGTKSIHPLPSICLLWPTINSSNIVSLNDVPSFFKHDDKTKALRSSLSYLIESKNNPTQVGRRRLLWTSFNALYSYITPTGNERSKLKGVSIAIRSSINSFTRSLKCLNYGLSEGYLQMLPWSSITEQLKRGKQNNIDEHILEMDQRIAKAYSSRLSSTGDSGDIKKRVLGSYAKLESSNDATALTYMVTRYLYSIRNATFHGESPCPVYPHEYRRPCDVWIEDLLEATIVDLASLINEKN